MTYKQITRSAGALIEYAERYSAACRESSRVPNIAGFFRFYKLTFRDYDRLRRENADFFATLQLFFIDEALNSAAPAQTQNLLMKEQLLPFASEAAHSVTQGGLTILFEHDILADGE